MRKSTVETTVVAQAVFIPIDNSPCKEWARDKFPPDKGGQGGCLPVWRREKPWTGFLCFCHSRHPSVIPAKAGIHLRMARRVSGTQTDGWMPGWIPVCTGMTERGDVACWVRWVARGWMPAPSVIPPPSVIPAKAGIHLHVARRVSGYTNRQMDARMDSRLHGNDGKRGCGMLGTLGGERLDARSFCHSPSFSHSRESGNPSSHGKEGVWHTNRRMDARMDSRLHGNDGKKPPPEGGRWKVKGEGTFLSPDLSPPRKNGDQKERAGAQRALPECRGGQRHGYHRGTGMSPLRYNYQLHCHCN